MGLDPSESAERRFAETRGAWSDEEADRFVQELAEIWAGWPQANLVRTSTSGVAEPSLKAHRCASRQLKLANVHWPPTIGEPLPRAHRATGVHYKLRTYALNPEHIAGGPKARGFQMILGITGRDLNYLAKVLVEAIRHTPVTAVRDNATHGLLCEVQVPVRGLRDHKDRRVLVTTAWQLADSTTPPRLVSAYIKD